MTAGAGSNNHPAQKLADTSKVSMGMINILLWYMNIRNSAEKYQYSPTSYLFQVQNFASSMDQNCSMQAGRQLSLLCLEWAALYKHPGDAM